MQDMLVLGLVVAVIWAAVRVMGRSGQKPNVGTPTVTIPPAIKPYSAPTAANVIPVAGRPQITIRYQDSKGKTSERRVTVHAMETESRTDDIATVRAFKGYCHSRRAARTFLVRNVDQAIDPDTGEILDADSLQQWLLGRAT